MNSMQKTSQLVTTALLTALVLVCTTLLKIPVGPDCYIHLGDTVIYLAIILLPRPHATFAGSVGAAMADIIGGFAIWAGPSFIIKAGMVLIMGIFIDICKKRAQNENTSRKALMTTEIIGYVLAGAFAVIGYFVAEYLLYGNWLAAATCIPLNMLQVGVAAVLAVVISNALYNTSLSATAYYHRPRK